MMAWDMGSARRGRTAALAWVAVMALLTTVMVQSAANATSHPTLEIFDIQGDGSASPVVGTVVTSEDNVVTALGLDGFFMQTPASRSDGDVDTSDGIFVFTAGAPGVAVGDLVDVTGTVIEFFGMTQIGKAMFPPTVTVVGTGAVPSPVVFDAAVPSPDPAAPSCAIEFECYEGMLIEITGGTVTGPNQRFGSDLIAEVHIVAGPNRALREKGIEYPGMAGLPVWDGNPEVFELDPDKLGLANEIIPAGSTLDATGVLGFEFGGYELWPTELSFTAAPLPKPVRARQPGEFTVATLNLFRFFDDVDDLPDNGRDDFVASTAEYERRRTKFASYIVDVLDVPDVVAVQEAEKLAVLEDLAAEINALDPAVVYSAHLVEGNDIGTIDVGFLVRDTVVVDAIIQFAADEVFSGDGKPLHDRPPLLLEGRFQTGFGAGFPVAVLGIHARSLADADTGPVQQRRLEAAESIAEIVQGIQNADPDVHLIVAGDFNAFQFTDGYVDVVGTVAGDFDPGDNLLWGTDLVDPNLANQITLLPESERYSFIFRGSAQAIDHALSSQALGPFVSGLDFGRGNADAAIDLINDASTPLRASDHDGLVLYLMADSDGDGVSDDVDVCAGTEIPEPVPTRWLGVNRYALVDGDGVFDTRTKRGKGPKGTFTVADTAGCSAHQIIEAQGLGKGHRKHGLSRGALLNWIKLVGA